MTAQIFIGLFSEGNTDIKFFESVVLRTFIDVAFECDHEIDVSLFPIQIEKSGLNFIQQVTNSSELGLEQFGIMTLCVHVDADAPTTANVCLNKIIPARQHLATLNKSKYCTLLTPLIPVQMMEAWMLADTELLKKEIGTAKSDSELGFNKHPENFADPKRVIIEAIKISRLEITKRKRRDLRIDDIYQSIGSKINLNKLELLQSFKDFKDEIRNTFRYLNYLH